MWTTVESSGFETCEGGMVECFGVGVLRDGSLEEHGEGWDDRLEETVLLLMGGFVTLAVLDGVEFWWPIGRELEAGSLERDGGRGSERALPVSRKRRDVASCS